MGTIDNALAEMQGNSVYFDTNLFVYFLDRYERYFDKCLPFFKAAEDGSITGVSGDLVIAELLVKPLRENDIINVQNIHSLFDSDGVFQVLPHDRSTLEFAAHIRATQKLAMVDAIHLATAIRARCSHIITNDEQVAKRAKGIKVIRLES
jgi:predicted nucleic acid-binding protein